MMKKEYAYIDKDSKFRQDVKDFYEENGYYVFKNNIDHELLDELKQRFIDICDGKITDFDVMIVMKDPTLKKRGVKGEYLINKFQDFLQDNHFFKYCMHDGIVDVVENIIGPNITACHSMLINKPPDADPGASRHPLHQDLHYFPFRPANRIVASWTAMERVDENNGCLYVVPGSHKQGKLYQHDYPEDFQNKFYHGVRGFDHLPKVQVVMEKGDTVFFHPLLLHGSGPNRTKGFRKAISTHFADNNCEFIDIKGTTQENIGKEIEDLVAKRGLVMKYNTEPSNYLLCLELKECLARKKFIEDSELQNEVKTSSKGTVFYDIDV